MCGICGFCGFEDKALLRAMAHRLVHRGPDDEGFFEHRGVGLGHRRLSIIDVAGGRQPLLTADGRFALVINGEIYNYRELRAELEAKGVRFQTQSDSETVLHLYAERGPAALERLNGMFALALWDTQKGELFLARDRLGIKPLYYAQVGERLAFASESKALLAWPEVEPEVCPLAVHRYLALRYSPGPGGLLKGIHKLPAGHWARFRAGRLELHRYWEPPLHRGPFQGSDEEWLEGFAEHFEESIRRRLVSEVPVGAYLSGGLDSSTIVAAIARETRHPVKTFTVGFDTQHDELEAAARTAKELGCEHTPIACRVGDVDLLPKLVWHLDEPVGDPIVIPMYQLAREAKRQVTVILTGEGADETLGGYLFHRALLMGNRLARTVPRFLRRGLLQPALAATPAALLNLAFQYPAALGKRGKQKLQDFLALIEPRDLPAAYTHLISLFDGRDTPSLYHPDFQAAVEREAASSPPLDADPPADAPDLNRILHLSFGHWLPDDILTKQDKMSMASGIEGRVPFLDHELVEFALSMPPHLKIRRRASKHVLRRYAERLLPKSVTAAKKMPFYNPIEQFFEQPAFQEFLHETLSDETVEKRGLFRPEAVRRLRESMRKSEFVFVKQVFSLIVLELWFQMAVDRRGALPA